MPLRPRTLLLGPLLALPLVPATSGCLIKQAAVGGLAEALSGSAEAFRTEDDPELVRGALPFALKSMETLLLARPDDAELLEAACAAFTLYSYAFVELDAEKLQDHDYVAAVELRERALRLYLRARDYGLRALELRYEGIGARLLTTPEEAAARVDPGDIGLAYWTGTSWGAAIALGLDRPEIAADFESVRALLRRVLELDETFDGGAIHETMIAIEALPEMMGGSPERARMHFERAVELSGGHHCAPYVTFATTVVLREQDRGAFDELLQAALAVDLDADPSARLANRLSRARAELFLRRADDLFLEPLE